MLCPHKSSLHSCFFCKHSSLSSFSSQGPLPQALSFIRSPQTNHHLSCPLGADCATLSLSAASASQQCGTTEPQQASAKGRHTQAHTHTWVCMHTVFFPLRKMSDKGKPTSARRAPAACLTSPLCHGHPSSTCGIRRIQYSSFPVCPDVIFPCTGEQLLKYCPQGQCWRDLMGTHGFCEDRFFSTPRSWLGITMLTVRAAS